MPFEIETGIVRITDPKFSKHSWKSICLNNCKTGNWYPIFETLDNKIIGFTATHNNIWINSWKDMTTTISVESGIVGIYDEKYYKDNNVVPDDFNFNIVNGIRTHQYSSGYGKWYDMNFLSVDDKNRWAIVSFGCVIKSSNNIKTYFIHETKKEIDGIRLSFYEH